MVRKKGWIRILEATIAVMIVSGVLLVIYSGLDNGDSVSQEFVFNLQEKILSDITLNETLRLYVLKNESGPLIVYADSHIPNHLNFSLRLCDLAVPCKLDDKIFKKILDKDVFVEETVVSANFDRYSPQKVKLFIWEN